MIPRLRHALVLPDGTLLSVDGCLTAAGKRLMREHGAREIIMGDVPPDDPGATPAPIEEASARR